MSTTTEAPREAPQREEQRAFVVHMPESLYASMRKQAFREERSMSEMCRDALREYIDTHKNDPRPE